MPIYRFRDKRPAEMGAEFAFGFLLRYSTKVQIYHVNFQEQQETRRMEGEWDEKSLHLSLHFCFILHQRALFSLCTLVCTHLHPRGAITDCDAVYQTDALLSSWSAPFCTCTQG
jgi:hypothetical protein